MGKNRHQKDRLYLIHSELNEIHKKSQSADKVRTVPFNYCCLNLTKILSSQSILADKRGNLFDKESILRWLEKYSQNPVDGSELTRKGLIECRFTYNKEDEEICPISFKTFNENSVIVLNPLSGYIYSLDAIRNLCKTLCRDPITDAPFKMKDLIYIHNPGVKETRTAEKFDFIRKDIDVNNVCGREEKRLIVTAPTAMAKRIHEELEKEGGALEKSVTEKLLKRVKTEEGYRDPLTGELKVVESRVKTRDGVSQSVTSTSVEVVTKQKYQILTSREYRDILYRYIAKKRSLQAFLSLRLKEGETLRLTLDVSPAPENTHQVYFCCQKGFYDGMSIYKDALSIHFCHRAYFEDVEQEVKSLDYLRAGTIYQDRHGGNDNVHIAVRGSAWDPDRHITVLGSCKDTDVLEAVYKKETVLTIVSGFVHSQPFTDAEARAIENYKSAP